MAKEKKPRVERPTQPDSKHLHGFTTPGGILFKDLSVPYNERPKN